MFWYRFFKFTIVRPMVKYGYGTVVIGEENFPAKGGAILASNHLGALDSLVVPAMMPRPITFPAKAELFSGKGFGPRFIAWFLKTIKMVPMDRSGGRASANALQAISDVLADGHVVAIYPEGTRSPDGRLYKGKTGVARMALSNEVPIIPVGVSGSKSVKGPFGIPWVKRPVVVIGEPLDFSQYFHTPGNSKVLRYVTDETMAAIQRLTGQDYVDVYGTRLKSGDLTPEQADGYVLERPGGGEPPVIEARAPRAEG